jgi:hypothetical protein
MSSPEAPILQGGCACGAVAYEVEDAFRYAFACHCSRCRKATGAASKPFGGIEPEKVRLVRGEASLLVVGDPANSHDLRCAACGSLLYSLIPSIGKLHVAYGSLTDPPGLPIQGHIMVGSKAPWDVI